ncbi:putative metal dependent phosphohydrolase [Candidatus Termititenax persephonae]|uniref:Metal dependent phosphohydrolase n=1 Tax=Candidatus Termititenax persephonae TaxID=2218525 RepID=A0A388TFC0_9BACT|nr:putative metal dependent phosphohydrolase [Candidatus Termititenax persephonae]
MVFKKNKLDWAEFLKRTGLIEFSIAAAWFVLSSLIIVVPSDWRRALALLVLNGAGLGLIINKILTMHARSIFFTKRIFLLLALISCSVLLAADYLLPLNPLLVPLSAATAIYALVYGNRSVAIYLTIYLSFVLALQGSENYFFYFTVHTIQGLFMVYFSSVRTERNSLAYSAVYSALAGIAAIVMFCLLGQSSFVSFYANAGALLLSAVCSIVVIIGLLPYIEDIFYIITPTKLLELASPANPLLRRLSMEAPGTYHHSLIVANLADAAAESIKANALLARVGAYYHDIGKIKRPLFFVENQHAFDNPHNQLNPHMSSQIIIAHTRDGAALGREYKLPQLIIDIIRQHHGDSVVTYFLHTFKEANAQAAESERTLVNENDFRYPGPKPQTKEAAVIMLADSCEAAVRTLEKPTPSRVNNLIGRLIKEKLDAGQLADCPLTIRELTAIQLSLQKTVANMFHNRIAYNDKSKG